MHVWYDNIHIAFAGGVSDWKNLFNEDQNQEMDNKFEEYLAVTKLGAKLNYGVHCKAWVSVT